MGTTDAAWFARLRAPIRLVSVWLERVGLAALVLMGLTALVDVIGSKLFHLPLPGSTEITAVIQMVAIAGGLAYSEMDGRHIRVDFLFAWLPERGQASLDLFGSILSLTFFAVAGCMMYENGMSLFESGTSTFLLKIPLAPFAVWIALCSILMCCVIILKLFAFIQRMLE